MRKRSRETQSTIESSPSKKKQKPAVKLLPSEQKTIFTVCKKKYSDKITKISGDIKNIRGDTKKIMELRETRRGLVNKGRVCHFLNDFYNTLI